MASSSSSLSLHLSSTTTTTTSTLLLSSTSLPSFLRLHPIKRSFVLVRCGPRDNRGPLVKGRILSTEAIQAIQSLKRAYRNLTPTQSQPQPQPQLPSLSRLLKSDLLATLRELLRQDQCALALHVLSIVRSEYPPPDLALLADVVAALSRNRMMDEIDGLIHNMEAIELDDERALVRLIKGVIGAGRRESTVRICGLMRENGAGSEKSVVGDYVVKVLSKGLRRFGEVGLALEVEKEFGGPSRVSFDNARI